MQRWSNYILGLISGGLSHMWISGWNKMINRFYRYLNVTFFFFFLLPPPSSWVETEGQGLSKLFPAHCWGGWEIISLKGRIMENFVFWMSSSSCYCLVFQNLSTSPLAEPPHFVSHIRSTLTFLKEHPFPSRSLFPDRKPRIYKKNEEGLWEQVCSDKS